MAESVTEKPTVQLCHAAQEVATLPSRQRDMTGTSETFRYCAHAVNAHASVGCVCPEVMQVNANVI
eukprot:CAMPEP_0172887236 /NCGR_PEP_ID=MMETSP1075-20121228/133430_1 /TAXON_ID=2916 /ORGANISM="Ceratium fusus, Strain PA161109" /LENGTH=65 /DNA_ID=CAMNT_0013740879 /DNA_START=172 /DNA_END=369 /DNA_ORIENTATION=+